MRKHLVYLALVAVTVLTVGASSTLAARGSGTVNFLFNGRLDAPASGGHFMLHMTDGNHRALKALLGAPLDQAFTYDAHTIFVLWQGGVPQVISPSQMVVGDRISVRIRAPQAYSLAQVEAVPANHVGDHEPFTNVSSP